jgi:hypothetical protein
MSAPTEQFAEFAQRSQDAIADAVTTAVRTWTQTVKACSPTFAGRPAELPDVQAAVNAAFDLAEQLLHDQRELVKAVLGAGVQAAEALAEQTVRATRSLTARTEEATERVIDLAAETSKRTSRAARNGVAV